MSITLPSLSEALYAVGNAQVFIGDPFTASGLAALGRKEGEAREEIEEEYSDLTTESTGSTIHDSLLLGVNVRITVPIVVGAAALYNSISPTGARGGGWSYPQSPVETSVLLIPEGEVAGGLANATGATAGWVRTAGNGFSGGTGASGAPTHAIWLWRARVSRGGRAFSHADGGKTVVEVTFQGMYYGANPEGHKVYTIGDPTAQGITTIRI